MPRIHFLPDDKTVDIKEGESIHDAALQYGIQLTHVCGGNGRCSTCRLLILEGLENCSPRSDKEKNIASYMSFGPEIRLACQTTVAGDVKVRRLTIDDYDVELDSKFIVGEQSYLPGIEKHVCIMFADIRGFTAFAESLLPYDVVHILHRFFHFMNAVVTKYDGYIDNYLGDGFMALFEVENPEEGTLSAVKAGLEMLDVLRNQMSPYVEKLFSKTFEIRIGLHYGLVVAGTIGGSGNRKATVIGDAVNFASRIESANKQMGTDFLISKDTFGKIASKVEINRTIKIKIPGKTGIQTLYEVTGLKE